MKTKRLPPLKSLEAFEAAGRHESFLDAAAEQGVTSGSISRHVRLLENYLGAELFVRRSNGVTLTAAGKEYAGTVSGILKDLRTATDSVRKPSGDRAIVISTLPIFSERWLYRRIPSFRQAFDRAELRVEAHNGEHDADREDVDAWILYSKGQHPRLQRHAAVRGSGFPPSAARNSARRCRPAPAPTRSSPSPCCTTSTGTPTGRTGRAPSTPPPASLPPTCALRSTRASSKRRSTAWGWPSGMARWVAKELATGKLVSLPHLSVASEKSYHLVMTASSANDPTLVRLKEWLLQECAGRQAVGRLTVFHAAGLAPKSAVSPIVPPGCADRRRILARALGFRLLQGHGKPSPSRAARLISLPLHPAPSARTRLESGRCGRSRCGGGAAAIGPRVRDTAHACPLPPSRL